MKTIDTFPASIGGLTGKMAVNSTLPAGNNSVDSIISNCVINLAPDKKKVFREAFRVLQFGGRIMISGIVWVREIPMALLESVGTNVACLSGVIRREEYLEAVEAAGFEWIRVVEETPVPFPFGLTSFPPPLPGNRSARSALKTAPYERQVGCPVRTRDRRIPMEGTISFMTSRIGPQATRLLFGSENAIGRLRKYVSRVRYRRK